MNNLYNINKYLEIDEMQEQVENISTQTEKLYVNYYGIREDVFNYLQNNVLSSDKKSKTLINTANDLEEILNILNNTLSIVTNWKFFEKDILDSIHFIQDNNDVEKYSSLYKKIDVYNNSLTRNKRNIELNRAYIKALVDSNERLSANIPIKFDNTKSRKKDDIVALPNEFNTIIADTEENLEKTTVKKVVKKKVKVRTKDGQEKIVVKKKIIEVPIDEVNFEKVKKVKKKKTKKNNTEEMKLSQDIESEIEKEIQLEQQKCIEEINSQLVNDNIIDDYDKIINDNEKVNDIIKVEDDQSLLDENLNIKDTIYEDTEERLFETIDDTIDEDDTENNFDTDFEEDNNREELDKNLEESDDNKDSIIENNTVEEKSKQIDFVINEDFKYKAEDKISIESLKEIENELKDNNTLIISEVEGKVFLPYYISDIRNYMIENKVYSSINHIIKTNYVVPLSHYRFQKMARYRETYQLMRYKENASIFEAMKKAYNVSLNKKLDPAIITACKNHWELDTYISCLNDNELDQFNIFNIKYEVRPNKKTKLKFAEYGLENI